jgi:iron(III) transport system substrate-binding protein
MKRKIISTLLLILITTSLVASGTREDLNILNVYSILPLNIANPIFDDFAEDNFIKVNIKKVSADELVDLLEMEDSDDWGDLIFGGPVAFYDQCSKYDILYPFEVVSNNRNLNSYKSPDDLWAFLGINPAVFLSNKNFLDINGIEAPTRWLDILYPSYKGNIVLSDPRLFGNMELIFSLTSIYGLNGEQKFQERIDNNIFFYARERDNVAQIVAEGQAGFTITDLVSAQAVVKAGFDVSLSFPKEGVTYGIACIGILKDGDNLNNSKEFYKWMKSKEYQMSLIENEIPYIPVDNIYTYENPYFDFSKVKLLNTEYSWKVATKYDYIDNMKVYTLND